MNAETSLQKQDKEERSLRRWVIDNHNMALILSHIGQLTNDQNRTYLSNNKRERRAEYAVAASWHFPSLTNKRSEMESSLRQQGDTDGTM